MAVNPENISCKDRMESTSSLYIREMSIQLLIDMPLGVVMLAQMPFQDINEAAPSISNFFDLLMDSDGSVTPDRSRLIFQEAGLSTLPETFSLVSLLTFTYKLQLAILPQANSKHCIVKRYYVNRKVKPAAVVGPIRGITS
jgi:hypothetical protein